MIFKCHFTNEMKCFLNKVRICVVTNPFFNNIKLGKYFELSNFLKNERKIELKKEKTKERKKGRK